MYTASRDLIMVATYVKRRGTDRAVLQRWIYRIDPKRVNEFGQVMVEDADAVAKAEGKEATETKKNK